MESGGHAGRDVSAAADGTRTDSDAVQQRLARLSEVFTAQPAREASGERQSRANTTVIRGGLVGDPRVPCCCDAVQAGDEMRWPICREAVRS